MWASRVLVAVVVLAGTARADELEVGGTVGGLSSTMKQTYPDCGPQPPGDDCVESLEAHARRRGIATGMFVRYPLVRALLVQAELVYVQKGFEVTQPTFHVDYLELPLLLRIDPLRHQLPVRFAFAGGLAPALRVRCQNSGSFFMAGAAVPYDEPCEDAPSVGRPMYPARFDLGVVVGASIAFDSTLGIFELEARGERGLIDNGAWGPGGRTAFEAFYVRLGYAHVVRR